jgi:hypothetical protein
MGAMFIVRVMCGVRGIRLDRPASLDTFAR